MARVQCIIGGRRTSRDAAARAHVHAGERHTLSRPPRHWPFERHILPDASDLPDLILIPDLHRAFPAGQTSGTRLVLTQGTYHLQRWIDWLAAHPHVRVVAHASKAALSRCAPESFAGRGAWGHVEIIELDEQESEEDLTPLEEDRHELELTFDRGSPEQRLDACRRAIERAPGNSALHLALGSVHMELQELDVSQRAIETALSLAPDWEAPWFEYGKLWLRADDLERAAERFAEAARLMPTFSAALSNLGAALAETDRPDEAVAALRQALQHDPEGYPILNNLAVICREQGRLDEAVEASRRVVSLAPRFVFGYYNLGHALFLQGRFADARDAYAEGHARDPQKNAVQACRLAVARAAAGEIDRAIAELRAIAAALPDEVRSEVLGEAEGTVEALVEGPLAGSEEMMRVLREVRAYSV